jgi:hypothetical protein
VYQYRHGPDVSVQAQSGVGVSSRAIGVSGRAVGVSGRAGTVSRDVSVQARSGRDISVQARGGDI